MHHKKKLILQAVILAAAGVLYAAASGMMLFGRSDTGFVDFILKYIYPAAWGVLLVTILVLLGMNFKKRIFNFSSLVLTLCVPLAFYVSITSHWENGYTLLYIFIGLQLAFVAVDVWKYSKAIRGLKPKKKKDRKPAAAADKGEQTK